MTGAVPPLGRCGLCGHRRHVSTHRSRHDGLPRLLCTACFSRASVTEDAGHVLDWAAGHQAEVEGLLQQLLDSAP